MTGSVVVKGWVIGIRENGLDRYLLSIDSVGEIEIKHNTSTQGKFPIHINDWVEMTIEVKT